MIAHSREAMRIKHGVNVVSRVRRAKCVHYQHSGGQAVVHGRRARQAAKQHMCTLLFDPCSVMMACRFARLRWSA